MTTADRNRSVAPSLARSILRLVLWALVLVASHVLLTAAASSLPAPPVPWDLDALSRWSTTTETATAAFAILRLVALATTWYLAAVTVLAVVARVSGSHPLAALADVVALPFARRLLRHVLGAGLTVSLAGGLVPLTAGAAGAQPVRSDALVTMHVTDADATTTPAGASLTMRATGPDATAPPAGGSLTMRAADPGGASADDTLARTDALARRIHQQAPTAPQLTMRAVGTPATWTAAPGDHLWQIAEATLSSAWSRPPTDDEVGRYWRTLVDANRDRLPIPGNADVIYPGQVFTLPPVPAG